MPLDQLNDSLGLIDQSARALRFHIVDDLHLAGIFASLLETYTQAFRARFVRVPQFSRPMGSGWPTADPTAQIENHGSVPNGNVATAVANDDYGMDQLWFAHPFDSSIAPFGAGLTQPFGVFDDDLNFVWN